MLYNNSAGSGTSFLDLLYTVYDEVTSMLYWLKCIVLGMVALFLLSIGMCTVQMAYWGSDPNRVIQETLRDMRSK